MSTCDVYLHLTPNRMQLPARSRRRGFICGGNNISSSQGKNILGSILSLLPLRTKLVLYIVAELLNDDQVRHEDHPEVNFEGIRLSRSASQKCEDMS